MIHNIRYIILSVTLLLMVSASAQTMTTVKPFDKIIISPHIQVTFVAGNEESVNITNTTVDKSKIHIEVHNKTLRVYLEGAKEIEKNETSYNDGDKQKHSLYQGTVVTATITYKTLYQLSIRGNETQVCESPIKSDKFILTIYGESNVVFNKVNIGKLVTTLYGQSSIKFLSGVITTQKYTAYGEGKVNSLLVSGNSSHITAYGEASFKMNVRDEIKITSFGEAKLYYTGSPIITKGLQIGKAQIQQMN